MPPVDLHPAAARLAELVRSVPDERLADPTPCPAFSLGDLLDHVEGFCTAFTAAATKTRLEPTGSIAQGGDAAHLGDGWRTRISATLDDLAAAWADPEAWTGMTYIAAAGDLPGEVAGLVVLDELVVHGWDVARGLGQPYLGADDEAAMLVPFVSGFDGPRSVDGPFAPVISTPVTASSLDQLLGLTGRDPGWTPG